MSKIGKMPIKINTAKLEVSGNIAKITGPKGSLQINIPATISVETQENEIFVKSNNISQAESRMFWGLTRSLINNAVIGVEEGFKKELELVGVGYRVEKTGNDLKILIGYSHPVIVKAPEGITFEVEGNTIIRVLGYDKQVVGQISAEIREIRKPEPYKGKGIKYKDEIVKRKQGKKTK